MVSVNRNSNFAIEKPIVSSIAPQANNNAPNPQTVGILSHNHPIPNRNNTVDVNLNASKDNGHAVRSISFPQPLRVTTSLAQRVSSFQNQNNSQGVKPLVRNAHPTHITHAGSSVNHANESHGLVETVNHTTHGFASRFEQSAIPGLVRTAVTSKTGATVGRITRSLPGTERVAQGATELFALASNTRLGTVGRGASGLIKHTNNLIHVAHGGGASSQGALFNGISRVAGKAGLTRISSGTAKLASRGLSDAEHASHIVAKLGQVSGEATGVARVTAKVLPGVARGIGIIGKISPGIGFAAGATGAVLALNDARHAKTTAGRNIAYVRAGLNVVSAGASLVPGAGTLVGLIATGADIGLDLYAKRNKYN